MKLSPSEILLVLDLLQERNEKWNGHVGHLHRNLQRQLTHERKLLIQQN